MAYSKLYAGRDQDYEYIGNLLKHRLINRGKIDRLIANEERPEIKERLKRNWTIAKAKHTAKAKPRKP